MTIEDDADIEAVQAQIDLANSVTHDLVSSWMKPSSSQAPSLVSQQISRELEEFAKRPSRLGLGATISKSNAAAIREAARLKGKLTSKKRPHEDGALGSTGNEKIDSEGEEESRYATISTKKPRHNRAFGSRKHEGNGKPNTSETQSGVDPHMNGGNEKLKMDHKLPAERVNGVGPSGSFTQRKPFITPKMPSPSSTTDSPSIKDSAASLDTSTFSSDALSISPSKKRRKRHKNKTQITSADTSVLDVEWTGFDGDIIPDVEADIGSNGMIPDNSQLSNLDLVQESTVRNLTSPTKVSPESSKIISLFNSEKPISSAVDHQDAESTSQTVNASPSKKRRRRRKEAKSRQSDAAT